MNSKAVLFTILLTCVVVAGSQTADGAQLNTIINPNNESSEFEINYQKTIFIEYEEGGEVADLLRSKSWTLGVSGNAPDPDVVSLRNAINQKIITDGSGTQISDLFVEYSAVLTGRGLNTAVDYKVTLVGTLTGYNIATEGGVTGQTLVDLGWRGMSVAGPVMIDGVEINMPLSAIQANEPEVYAYIAGTAAGDLLSQPLIDAEGIKNQPLTNWHFLFDPTGIGVDAGTFGISDEIKGFVVSGFTMGESSLREGRQVEREFHETFTADRAYNVRTVQSADTANLSIIGFAAIDRLADLEIAGVTPRAPEGYATTSTGEFPVLIIYGMAGLAVVGGGAFFVFSNRQLKKEGNQGQTGIDPSRLTGYQTSSSAGGYQTNRGEAQLTDAGDYAQTRSVYDNSEPQQETPAIPYTSDAACGCASSADAGNECDCQMQGQCFCDAACECGMKVCKSAVKDMQ